MTRANGFTLVELLASMVAGSLLLASISWVLSSLTRQLPIAETEIQDSELELLAPVLVGMLEQVSPPSGRESSFNGSPTSISGIVPPPLSAKAAGPLRLTLNVREANGGQGLFLNLAPEDVGSAFPVSAGRERLLVQGYSSIGFEYLAQPKTADMKPLLPRMITLRFTSASGAVRRISATPRLSSDGRCRFDPISMTCRP